MRDLTEEELKLAPSWATHYWIHDNKIMFESEAYFQLLGDGVLGCRYSNAAGYVSSHAQEFSKKPFDITKHEFSDSRITLDCVDGEGDINIYYQENYDFYINKQDAIAIAKAHGVTGEDLK